MKTNYYRGLIQNLLDSSREIQQKSSRDPDFKIWKNQVEKNLTEIFGIDSIEIREFKKLNFFYKPRYQKAGSDFAKEHNEVFIRDTEIIIKALNSYLQDFKENINNTAETNLKSLSNKVFISHASKDAQFVVEIIDLLEYMGLSNNQIFCSSLEGYGINLGDNFLETIKKEINESTLILFVLSDSFFSSPVCLCEMGATWIRSTKHIPILIPPFDFADLKGVIPLTQGFKINDRNKWNLLKVRIENDFKLTPLDSTLWERKRNKTIKNIENVGMFN